MANAAEPRHMQRPMGRQRAACARPCTAPLAAACACVYQERIPGTIYREREPVGLCTAVDLGRGYTWRHQGPSQGRVGGGAPCCRRRLRLAGGVCGVTRARVKAGSAGVLPAAGGGCALDACASDPACALPPAQAQVSSTGAINCAWRATRPIHRPR